jgi:hypothetical protein
MIALTAVIAAAGVVGACIFNNQLAVMQGQLEEMKSTGKQTDAVIEINRQLAESTKDAADSAKKSAQATELNANALMNADGAQLWMDEIRIHGIRTAPTALKLTYTIRNFGNSPGWVHHMPIYVRVGTALPSERTIDQADTPEVMLVPSKHFTNGERSIPPTAIPQVVIDALLAPNPTTFVFIYGSINYQDIFGRERRAGFAYKVPFGSGDVSENTPIAGGQNYWDFQ